MISRRLAPLALGAAILLGATGCSMVSPQATTIPYSPSDGVNVPASGPLQVRNAMVIANEDGTLGNFIGAIVNDTDSAETLNVGIAGRVATVQVPARSVVSLGVDGAQPLFIDSLGAAPGDNVEMAFQSGDGTGVEVAVPVLDGTLPQYAEFVPVAVPVEG